MASSEAQKRARDKWDKAHMKNTVVKSTRELADAFEEACTRQGRTRNAVLLEYIRWYVAEYAPDLAEAAKSKTENQ